MEAASSSSSSSSDDDESSSSSTSVSTEEVNNKHPKMTQQRQRNDLDVDEHFDDDNDDDDSASSSSSSSDDDHDDDSRGSIATEDNQEDLRLLPLGERIKRQEMIGIDMKEQRERKQKALKEVSASKKQQEKTTTTEQEQDVKKKKKKKKSKHAPTEMSSKRKDSYRQKIDLNASGIGVELNAHKYKPKDPRQNNLHGHFNIDHYDRNYKFLHEIREKEIQTLKQRINAYKLTGSTGRNKRRKLGITNGTSLEIDQMKLKQLLYEKSQYEKQLLDRTIKQTIKKKIGGAYHPKRKQYKQMYTEIKNQHELQQKRNNDDNNNNNNNARNVIKRRKRNKSKDAKKMMMGW